MRLFSSLSRRRPGPAARAWVAPSRGALLGPMVGPVVGPLLLMLLLAGAAEAQCFADYKAKREPPLRLHYGVIELPDAACTPAAAPAEVARRIARDGWTLLNVVSLFGADGLEARRADAGAHFLRY